MRPTIVFLTIIALAFWGPAGLPVGAKELAAQKSGFAMARRGGAPAPAPAVSPGDYAVDLEHGGVKHCVHVHIPPRYTGRTPVPLLLALHGGGGSGDQFIGQSGFNAIADRETFIVIYPDGYGPLEHKGLTWNVKFGYGFAMKDDVDDDAFFGVLLDAARSNLAIDPKRIFVTGFSNGACMSHRLAALYPDQIAAICPIAGTIGGQHNAQSPQHRIPEPSQPVSVLIIHGMKDQSMPFNGGKQTVAFPGTPPETITIAVPDCVNFWVRANGCNPAPVVQDSPKKTEKIYSYGGGRNGTEVRLIASKSGTHAWPGCAEAFLNTPNLDFNASEVMWQFFKTHPKK